MIVDFLLSKDPETERGGDVAMTKLIMSLARESFSVRAIALSLRPELAGGGVIRVPKPPLNKFSLVAKSLRTRRSMVHSRFETREMAQAISRSNADLFVAEHSYMAEPFLAVRPEEAGTRLMVNTHVSEADVWKETKHKALQFEHKRLVRDEKRVATLARSVAYFDRREANSSPASKSHWLNLSLPPGQMVDRLSTPPTLVFLGDRSWPPNQDAAQRTLRLWPKISSGIANAKLVLVGKPATGAPHVELPPGVEDRRFVEDLNGLLRSARALIAPVRTGGGVRVKILEAATTGLPVVGTSAALGSLDEVFQLTAYDEDQSLVQAAREMLLDPALAWQAGSELYDANAARWQSEAPKTSVQDWLVG